MTTLIKPYGGVLNYLIVSHERADQIKRESENYQSITMSARQLCDLELMMNGALSPLKGFMSQEEYDFCDICPDCRDGE